MAQVPIVFTANIPAPTDGVSFPGWDTSSPPYYVKAFIPSESDMWGNAVIDDIVFTAAVDGLGENPPGTEGPAKISFSAIYNGTSSEPWVHYYIELFIQSNDSFTLSNPWPTVIINNEHFITPDPNSSASRQEFTAPDGRLVGIERAVGNNILVQVTMLNNTEQVPSLTIYAEFTEIVPPALGEVAAITFPPTSQLPPWSSWEDSGGGNYNMPTDGFSDPALVHGATNLMVQIPGGMPDDGLTNFMCGTYSDGTTINYNYQLEHVFNPDMSSRRRVTIPDWGIDETFDESRIFYKDGSDDSVSIDPYFTFTTITTNLPWGHPGLSMSLMAEGGVGGALLLPMEQQQILLVKFPVPPPVEEWQTWQWSGVGTISVPYQLYGGSSDGTADTSENGGVFEQFWTRVLPSFADQIYMEAWYWFGHPLSPKPYNRMFNIYLRNDVKAPGPFFLTVNGALIVPEYDPTKIEEVEEEEGAVTGGLFKGFFVINEPGMDEETLVEVNLAGIAYNPGVPAGDGYAVDISVNIYSSVLPEGETLVKVFLGTPGQYFWTNFRGSRELA